MRRPWAVGTVLAGSASLAYAAVAFVLDLGGPEAAETLGGMALILGLFLLVEGVIALHRVRRLDAGGRGTSPK